MSKKKKNESKTGSNKLSIITRTGKLIQVKTSKASKLLKRLLRTGDEKGDSTM